VTTKKKKKEEDEDEKEESDGMDFHGIYPLINSISTIELRMNEMDSTCVRREMYTGLVVGKSEELTSTKTSE
jgi:hypothetical protein